MAILALSSLLATLGSTATTAVAAAPVASGLTASSFLTGASAVSALGSGVASFQAGEAASKAAGIKQKQRKLQAARERRRVVRESQAARASIVAQAESQGVEGGSTARIGALQGVASQEGANLSFLNQQTALGAQGTSALNRSNRLTGISSFLGSTSSVFGSDQADRLSRTLFQ